MAQCTLIYGYDVMEVAQSAKRLRHELSHGGMSAIIGQNIAKSLHEILQEEEASLFDGNHISVIHILNPEEQEALASMALIERYHGKIRMLLSIERGLKRTDKIYKKALNSGYKVINCQPLQGQAKRRFIKEHLSKQHGLNLDPETLDTITLRLGFSKARNKSTLDAISTYYSGNKAPELEQILLEDSQFFLSDFLETCFTGHLKLCMTYLNMLFKQHDSIGLIHIIYGHINKLENALYMTDFDLSNDFRLSLLRKQIKSWPVEKIKWARKMLYLASCICISSASLYNQAILRQTILQICLQAKQPS